MTGERADQEKSVRPYVYRIIRVEHESDEVCHWDLNEWVPPVLVARDGHHVGHVIGQTRVCKDSLDDVFRGSCYCQDEASVTTFYLSGTKCMFTRLLLVREAQ